jgi:hypothetical protein
MMGSVDENPPGTFFEWDGTNLTAIGGPTQIANAGSFYGHLLPLPSGQILYTDWLFPGFGVPADVSVYTPTGTYNPAWAPKIVAASTNINRGTTYVLYGTQLAGVSQGGAYGDDYQPNTNYALVRLTNNATHHVFYCRTHNPSSYAVQSTAVQFTKYDVPAGAETGLSTLVAVTNGIPSSPITVMVH